MTGRPASGRSWRCGRATAGSGAVARPAPPKRCWPAAAPPPAWRFTADGQLRRRRWCGRGVRRGGGPGGGGQATGAGGGSRSGWRGGESQACAHRCRVDRRRGPRGLQCTAKRAAVPAGCVTGRQADAEPPTALAALHPLHRSYPTQATAMAGVAVLVALVALVVALGVALSGMFKKAQQGGGDGGQPEVRRDQRAATARRAAAPAALQRPPHPPRWRRPWAWACPCGP